MTTGPATTAREIGFRAHLGDPARVLRLLAVDGAIRGGHFRLLSGLHTNVFLAFSAIADDSDNLDAIASWLGPTVDAWAPNAILAPSTAGVGLAATLARRISAPLHLAAVGGDGRPSTLLGSSLSPSARVLVVNDVTTTGTGIRALADIARSQSADVVGAAWFASRAGRPASLDLPTAHVVDVNIEAIGDRECPQCAAGVDVIEDAVDLN